MATTITFSQLRSLPNSRCFPRCNHRVSTCKLNFSDIQQNFGKRLLFMSQLNQGILEHVANPISAIGSGLEASITDTKDNVMTFKNVKIVVDYQDESKIQLRVDLTGDETQKVFDKVLTDLARSAPPVPGFRRQKGGKTSNVPRDFLLQILGEERVTNFVIQEMVSSTMADYAKKENLNVKESKVTTTQKAEELKKLFKPGKDFGFNAVLELEKIEPETSS